MCGYNTDGSSSPALNLQTTCNLSVLDTQFLQLPHSKQIRKSPFRFDPCAPTLILDSELPVDRKGYFRAKHKSSNYKSIFVSVVNTTWS